MPGILFGKLKIFYGLNMQTFRADFFQKPTFFDYSKHKPSGKIFVIIYKIFCRQHYQSSIFPMPIHFPNMHKKSRLKHR